MAASEFDWQSTRSDIIARAFRIVGALKPGQVLSGDKSAQGIQCLNDMIKSWQSDKVFLWSLVEKTVTLVVGTASYATTSDPKMIGIDSARWRESSNDTPVEVISWRRYQDIVDKTRAGNRIQYIALQPGQSPSIYVWPVPNAAAVVTQGLRYLGVGVLKDFDTNDSTGDFTARWANALVYGLADDLADEYGVPSADKLNIGRKAMTYKAIARAGDEDYGEETRMEPAYCERRF